LHVISFVREAAAGKRFADRYQRRPPPAFVARSISVLQWTLVFLVLALVAAVLGFGVLAASLAVVAKVLFVVFLALFLISLITGVVGRPPA